MKIMILENDSLLDLKSNLSQLAPKFVLPENDWITEYFGHSPFIESKIQIDDFTLDMSQDKPFHTEFENVKRVYTRLGSGIISDSQASDERLWSGLCLTYFWKYTQYRYDISKNCMPSNIEQHFFFGFGARRSLTRNAISRLWWIGNLTYDENREDPYELTRFVCENSNYIVDILERNTSNNKMITKAFISALLSARKEGLTITRDSVSALSRYLNLLGGTYILDCLEEETIHNKILNKARQLLK